ncbi:hypothetical protein ACLB2K_011370 [Fragaria x ananassa]
MCYLPPAWKDFKNYLKHKRKEMSMEDLEVRLCIEEDNRGFEKKAWVGGYSAKTNVVEHGQSSKTKKFKNQGSKLGPRRGIAKKARFEGKCFNCDKTGHKAVDCNKLKKKKSKEAYMIEDVTRDVSDSNLSVVVLEVNMVGSNPKEWWLDTGATSHVCADKKMFSKFEPTTDGEIMYMGNLTTSVIEGKGNVVLKMTSGKELTLNNILYVPDIHKNLIFGALLNTHGFRIVIEPDKVVLSKSGMYVGKAKVI